MQVSNNTLRNIWANKTQPVDTLSLPVGWVDGRAGNRTSRSMKLFEIQKEINIEGLPHMHPCTIVRISSCVYR